MSQCTLANIDKLKEEIKGINENIDALEEKSPNQLWQDDLSLFKEKYLNTL